MPTQHHRFVPVLALLLLVLLPSLLHARLHAANTLGSHMVLQRSPYRASIYGTADSWARISLTLHAMTSGDEQSYKTVANYDGNWEILLAPNGNCQEPFQIVITNEDTFEHVTLEDVMFGEVWLCSGQSNMQMTVNMGLNSDEEGETAESYPFLRLLTLQTNTSTISLDDILAPMHPWSVSSKEVVLGPDWQHFSALCYFFGQRISRRFKVPVGLVASSYGGTPIVAWSDRLAVDSCVQHPTTPSSLPSSSSSSLRGSSSNTTSPPPLGVYTPGPWAPSVPPSLAAAPSTPSVLFNAMIFPLRKMVFKGAIWYQGEADVYQPDYYECAFPAMIRGWREILIGSNVLGPMPFGFVQLSSYTNGPDEKGTEVGHMRLSQYSAFKEPAVFMAPSFDLGYGGDIHPKDKQDVADRLADAALLTAYHQVEYVTSLGPFIKKAIAAVVEENVVELKLTFENTFYGLIYTDVPGIIELVLDPSLRDSASQALLPSSFTRLDNTTYSFTFPVLLPSLLPSSSLASSSSLPSSVWLRYAGRNNVCPPRQVPREEGLLSASCGIYGKGMAGLRPLLPTWKEVELLPYPEQQEQ